MYNYQQERPWLFTEEGSCAFIAFRDRARALLKKPGAATLSALMRCTCGECPDSFKQIACIDRLVELGELARVFKAGTSSLDVYVPAGDFVQ